ncbi:MAG: metalloregulator ArsR/SmtB family transcription factor [Clostridia bacterium]|nr:metalloregulator ArsR/SmtB family transcription factor [Clostridia bacterium]
MENTDKLTQIANYLPNYDATVKLATFFSLFADSSRLRLISALAISNLCVTDIAQLLDMNQTTVSHQLQILRNLNAVTYRREGKVIYYELTSNVINDVLLLGVEYLGY